ATYRTRTDDLLITKSRYKLPLTCGNVHLNLSRDTSGTERLKQSADCFSLPSCSTVTGSGKTKAPHHFGGELLALG
ncbi:hypothetical protein, partial [Kineosporia babensis]